MARKPREWSPNTCYHVTCRGNRKSDIFKDQGDFEMYLKFLVEALHQFRRQTPYDLLCYCLMSNHVHLLIHTSTQPLGPFMQQVSMRYAMYFNKKYDYTGHLFQGRFYSDAVIGSWQILRTSRYIHLNPVVAHMVDLPGDYIYSSYGGLIGQRRCDFISHDRILSHFQEDRAHELYKEFVEA